MVSCNITKYTVWRSNYYANPALANNVNFYKYQKVPGMKLLNGLALDLVTQACTSQFKTLYIYQTGKTGPVSSQNSFDAMCSSYCLENDYLHQQAMTTSGCTCLELSTQPNDPTYRFPGDFCLKNSARQLCNIIGTCGSWNCKLKDFMCPRYEYNKQYIKLRGVGSTCFSNSANLNFSMNITLYVTIIVLLCFLLF